MIQLDLVSQKQFVPAWEREREREIEIKYNWMLQKEKMLFDTTIGDVFKGSADTINLGTNLVIF